MGNVIVYTDAGVFGRLKQLIKYFNLLETRQTSIVSTDYPLPYIKQQILDLYETEKRTDELATLETDFDAAVTAVGALKLALISYFGAALAGIASDLGEYNAQTPAAVLDALADAMTRDSQTLNRRELIVHASDVDTDATIKPHSSNIGTGRLVYTFIRQGLTPSEIANAEVLQCNCISSTTLKQEVFQLSGEVVHTRSSHLGQGSGLGPTMNALGTSITNGDFEDWTASAADNWTATVGAWGTEIVQEASAARYEGSFSVKTAYGEADWKITHALPITLLPNTVYVIALWAKKVATATGTLRFGISNGAAVAAYVSGCVKSVSVATLSDTAYALQFLAFRTPAAVDATWTIGISSEAPANADFYFDLCQFGAMSGFNEMNFAACSGATGFGVGDKFGFGSDNVGFEISESEPGVIQKFLGRCFGTQLPSATGAAETILDPT